MLYYIEKGEFALLSENCVKKSAEGGTHTKVPWYARFTEQELRSLRAGKHLILQASEPASLRVCKPQSLASEPRGLRASKHQSLEASEPRSFWASKPQSLEASEPGSFRASKLQSLQVSELWSLRAWKLQSLEALEPGSLRAWNNRPNAYWYIFTNW